MSFIDLGLSSGLCRNLSSLGYAEPTEVQAVSIPLALTGTDLLVGAQTGTGKTAAFALPILEKLMAPGRRREAAPRKPIALVLTPTRELACQVHESFRKYGAGLGPKSTVVFGGSNMDRQIQALRRGTHILVATPGRLIDHLMNRKVLLSSVEFLVLDEADRMLDMGFLPALTQILEALPAERQTWLFSATLEPEIREIASKFMKEPKRVQISSANSVASTIRHRFHPVNSTRKHEMLVHLLAEDVSRQTLVFCRTKMGCDRLTEYLDTGGFRVETIHGDKTQAARLQALRKFKEGRANVLVATDVAARGLDIQDLPVVVNFDLPIVPNDNIHRIGRTGRAGSDGQAVSFVSHDQLGLFRSIQRMLDQPVETGAMDGFDPGTTLDLVRVTPRKSPKSWAGKPERPDGGSRGHEPAVRSPFAQRSDSDRRTKPGGAKRIADGGRGESRSRFRDDARPGAKPRFRDDARPGAKPRFRDDARPGAKPRFRDDARPGAKPRFHDDAGSGAKPRFRDDARPGAKPRFRDDARPGAKPRFRDDARPGAKPHFRDDARSDAKPRFRDDAVAGARPTRPRTTQGKPIVRRPKAAGDTYRSRPDRPRPERPFEGASRTSSGNGGGWSAPTSRRASRTTPDDASWLLPVNEN